MEGAIELAEEVFHVPVRLGVPQSVRGLTDVVRNPIFSTGVGLLLYARDNVLPVHRGRSFGGDGKSVVERMRSWVQGKFFNWKRPQQRQRQEQLHPTFLFPLGG